MRYALSFALMLLLGSLPVFAQDEAASDAAPQYEKVSDSEAIIIIQSIKGYVQTRADQIEVFDRNKGEAVTLVLDKIVTDDPKRVVYTKADQIAVCGECSQIDPSIVIGKGETSDVQKTGDKYEVWFLVKRGTIPQSRVEDVIVKSANGVALNAWNKGENGEWGFGPVSEEQTEIQD